MNDGSKYQIQRRHQRADINLQVGLIHQLKYSLTYATQISEGGMLIYAEGNFNVGEPLELSFIFPDDGRLVFIVGEVAYTFRTNAGFQYLGIRFLEVPYSVREQIRSYIERT